MVRTKEDATFSQLLKSLHTGVWVGFGHHRDRVARSAVMLLGNARACGRRRVVSGVGIWGAIVTGLVAGLVIARATEYYTSYEYKPTQSIARAGRDGTGHGDHRAASPTA